MNKWNGCLGGHPDVRTPNIDRLAKRGVLFTNAHCAAPACNPSRTALMMGIRPWTSGVYKNPNPWRQSPALTNAATLPQHFMAHGRGNHSVRSERRRYIRYSDGTEELYDHDADELEWTNLASEPRYARVKKDLAKWLPKTDVPEVRKVRR